MIQSDLLSQREKKLILALRLRKVRLREGLFIAESPKLVGELLPYFRCRLLVTTPLYYREVAPYEKNIEKLILLPENFAFSSLSSLETPRPLIALLELPKQEKSPQQLSAPALLLDQVQDPGNVGSILRTADWFGITTLFTTEGTADVFSPKVVQATMGALAHIKIYPLANPQQYLQELAAQGTPILGTYLEGENLLSPSWQAPQGGSLLILGNEGKGISASLTPYVSQRISIPAGNPQANHVESLNVAAAAAILMAQLYKQQ